MRVKYGKELEKGDFIIIASGNYLDLGWYVGRGKSGTVQYYHLHEGCYWFDEFQKLGETPKYFSLKSLYKSYVNSVHEGRIANIENPESLFIHDEELLEVYNKSKSLLLSLNFNAK